MTTQLTSVMGRNARTRAWATNRRTPGVDASSLSDLGNIGDDLGHSLAGLEVVDLDSRYSVIRPIGKGGMGEVFLARDTRLNRNVAIKRILGRASRSKAAVSRFLIEARSIAALNHPNIVQIYDYGRANDGPFSDHGIR